MKILINRSDALGDTLLTIPLAQIIKEQFPQAQVYFLVRALSAPLLRANPYVDGTIILPTGHWGKRVWQMVQIFRRYQIDHLLYVNGDRMSNWVAALLRVPWRGGQIHKPTSWLWLNRGVRQRRSQVTQHEWEYNCALLQPLGIDLPNSKERFYSPLFLTTQERAECWQLVRDHEIFTLKERPFGLLHPGMTGHTLNWPVESYYCLLRDLVQARPQLAWVISYTPSDHRVIEPLRALIANDPSIDQRQLIWLNGATIGLRRYLAILSFARIFVGPSTGTTHMASALGVPLVGLYSPIRVQSLKRWAPLASDAKAHQHLLAPDVECPAHFHCLGERCRFFPCMEKISVDKVANEIIREVHC